MTISFAIIAGLTVAAAVAAMGMRQLVHCVLALTVAFAGLAAAYLQLDAQFVGFAQILVYIGAVAILIVFAILLTRGSEHAGSPLFAKGWQTGLVVALLVLAVLIGALAKSPTIQREIPPRPDVTVRQIGDVLMHKFVLPLEAAGVLLTAALIGAVLIAMRDRPMDAAAKPSDSHSEIPAPSGVNREP